MTDLPAKSSKAMPLIAEKSLIGCTKSPETHLPGLPALVQQSAQKALIKTLPVRFEKKKQAVKEFTDFSTWNMPEQESGVIKCRDHDFW